MDILARGGRGQPPLTLVILAAGRSTRFGRLKQLARIGPGGEALLDYALYDAALAGFTRFLLVIQKTLRPDFEAHLRDATARLDIRYAHQRMVHPGLMDDPLPGRTRPWGTGFAVLTAGERVDGSFAVCNADDFYGRGAYAALAEAMADAADPTPPPATPPPPMPLPSATLSKPPCRRAEASPGASVKSTRRAPFSG